MLPLDAEYRTPYPKPVHPSAARFSKLLDSVGTARIERSPLESVERLLVGFKNISRELVEFPLCFESYTTRYTG